MNTPPGAKNAFGEPLEPDEKNVREEFLLGLGFHRYRPSRSLARRTASRGSETPLRSLSAISGRPPPRQLAARGRPFWLYKQTFIIKCVMHASKGMASICTI